MRYRRRDKIELEVFFIYLFIYLIIFLNKVYISRKIEFVSRITGLVRLQNVVELIILGLDRQRLLVIHERGVIERLVVLRPTLHRGDGWWIGIRLEGTSSYLFSGLFNEI